MADMVFDALVDALDAALALGEDFFGGVAGRLAGMGFAPSEDIGCEFARLVARAKAEAIETRRELDVLVENMQ